MVLFPITANVRTLDLQYNVEALAQIVAPIARSGRNCMREAVTRRPPHASPRRRRRRHRFSPPDSRRPRASREHLGHAEPDDSDAAPQRAAVRADHVGGFLPETLARGTRPVPARRDRRRSAACGRRRGDPRHRAISRKTSACAASRMASFAAPTFHVDFLDAARGASSNQGRHRGQVSQRRRRRSTCAPPVLQVTGKVRTSSRSSASRFRVPEVGHAAHAEGDDPVADDAALPRRPRRASAASAYPDLESFYRRRRARPIAAELAEPRATRAARYRPARRHQPGLSRAIAKMREGARSAATTRTSCRVGTRELINAAIADQPAGMTDRACTCAAATSRAPGRRRAATSRSPRCCSTSSHVDGYFLEYDDARSGDFAPLRFVPKGKIVVLGLVTTKLGHARARRTSSSGASTRRRSYVPIEQLCLSPQCGFSSTRARQRDRAWMRRQRRSDSSSRPRATSGRHLMAERVGQRPGRDNGREGRAQAQAAKARTTTPFRFYDNRQKYLAFVNTCNEKSAVARRARARADARCSPRRRRSASSTPAWATATVLSRLMRSHAPPLPDGAAASSVAKEISLEDVRLGLDEDAGSLPASIRPPCSSSPTSHYSEAPRSDAARRAERRRAQLAGGAPERARPRTSTAEQIEELQRCARRRLADEGEPEDRQSRSTCARRVLVIYREDHKFLLDGVIPKPGHDFEATTISFSPRSRGARACPPEFKAQKVLAPLARSLAPAGRLLAIQSYGRDPGSRSCSSSGPDENPFQVGSPRAARGAARELGTRCDGLHAHRAARREVALPLRDAHAAVGDRRPHRHLDAVRRVERRDLREPDRGRAPRRRDDFRHATSRRRRPCCRNTAASGSTTRPSSSPVATA